MPAEGTHHVVARGSQDRARGGVLDGGVCVGPLQLLRGEDQWISNVTSAGVAKVQKKTTGPLYFFSRALGRSERLQIDRKSTPRLYWR